MRNSPEPPYLISWNLTRRCNLHCAHCYLDAEQLTGGRGDLSTNQALKIVEQIAAYSPAAMLILTGGEPLLRKDFLLLLKRLPDVVCLWLSEPMERC